MACMKCVQKFDFYLSLLSSIYSNFLTPWMCKTFHLSKPLLRELLVAARLANVDLVVLRGEDNGQDTDPLVGAVGETGRN